MKILVLNVGSSSLKSRLYELSCDSLPEEPPRPLWDAHADCSRGPAQIRVRTASGVVLEKQFGTERLREEFVPLIETLWNGETRVMANRSEIGVVGHRVVHGGGEFLEGQRITPEVAETIKRLSVLAPAHLPVEFDLIEAMEQMLGRETPQVAVFDTAFHGNLPPASYVYGGPYEWLAQGIRRYGFHGISHQYSSRRAARILGRKSLRLVSCHLGNGCSLAAVRDGKSIDTTMGFTPLEGLVMGTRSGSIDPGILIHLLRQGPQTAEQLDKVLNRDSGLKGISGVSGDMREIVQAMQQGHARARLAFEVFVHGVRFYIGAMIASLGGLDALVFTAGIGENSPEVRAAVCEGFEFFKVKLDSERNKQSPRDEDIAARDSKVRILVIEAQEDWEIARECWRLVSIAG